MHIFILLFECERVNIFRLIIFLNAMKKKSTTKRSLSIEISIISVTKKAVEDCLILGLRTRVGTKTDDRFITHTL